MAETKKCAKCGEEKPLSEFWKDKHRIDGLCDRCIDCHKKLKSNPKIIVREKRCTGCEEIKPIEEFHKSSMSKDNHAYRCKTCTLRADKDYRERNDKEYNAKQRARYSELSPEEKERRKQYHKQYRLDSNHLKHANELKRGYAQNAKNDGIEHYGGRCVFCGAIENLTIDHISPEQKREEIRRRGYKLSGKRLWQELKSRGWPREYQILCMTCNMKKGRGLTKTYAVEYNI